MKRGILCIILGVLLLVARVALGTECPNGSTCVPPEDMKVFLQLLQDKQCLQRQQPAFHLDPITIVTDRDGRIYTSGAQYHLSMKWCSYDVQSEGPVTAVAAMTLPQAYGFRFRPKAFLGYLPLEALKASDARSGLDGGLLLDFLHWEWANLNFSAGVRSGGLGLGADLTANAGVYAGYSITWGSWRHNPMGGFWFAF